MRVDIRDREALSSLSLLSLRTYLKSRQWNNEGDWGNRATLFRKTHENREWEILCPFRDTFADFAETMGEAISVLATVENRSQLDVFHDLERTGSDVIHVRSPNGMAEKALSLRQNTEMLDAAYSLLASAARAAEKPSAAYRGRTSSNVTDYLDNVLPLPGYHEGYDLTLHSPVPAGFGTQTDFGDAYAAPFSRRATKQLSKALHYTSRAITESVSGDTLEPFSQVVKEGVSANLCESVATLAENGRGIEIALFWAGVRPSNVPETDYKFSENSAGILSEAADFLRRNDPSFDEHLIAQVVKLEKKPKDFDGKAVLLTVRDERLVRIQAEFEQPVYDLVIQAFRNQEFVSLDGDILPTSNGYELRRPRNLTFVENNG
ncbi:MAG: hypothetical protein OXH93_11415 [Caldilineaceae bacterium]|nr:hypothetical protein [Caldilineaceae bacterium]